MGSAGSAGSGTTERRFNHLLTEVFLCVCQKRRVYLVHLVHLKLFLLAWQQNAMKDIELEIDYLLHSIDCKCLQVEAMKNNLAKSEIKRERQAQCEKKIVVILQCLPDIKSYDYLPVCYVRIPGCPVQNMTGKVLQQHKCNCFVFFLE